MVDLSIVMLVYQRVKPYKTSIFQFAFCMFTRLYGDLNTSYMAALGRSQRSFFQKNGGFTMGFMGHIH